MSTPRKLRLLLVPDALPWITGTMARNIVRYNPWLSAAIISGPVLDEVFGQDPELVRQFDLVHFLCQYSSKEWLPRFSPGLPVVTTHHHVADWELDRHNMAGDAIVVVAREWEEDLRARGIPMEKVFRYSNGVDARRFVPPQPDERARVRAQLAVPAGNVLVGFFAKRGSNNHNDRKGTDVFVQAVELLAGRLPTLSVLIVGPGWDTLVAQLRAKGVHCVWQPFVSDSTGMTAMYHALDFYWISSRVEGGPVPLLEAMSSGVCCVTTAVGLVPEIGVTERNLVIVPFNDAEAIATATMRLAAQPVARVEMGREARQTILEKKHLAITARAVAQAYNVAFDQFARRTGRARAALPDVVELARSHPPMGDASPLEFTPLEGIPASLHARIGMLENVHWGETLVEQGQRAEGLRWLRAECFAQPWALRPWRHYLRRALPPSAVASLVRCKQAWKQG